MTTAKHYYEAHITIDPVPAEHREKVQNLINPWRFKLAKLLMDKGVPSQLDTFMTGHDKELENIADRVTSTVVALRTAGYKVRRYKIEDTILDSRISDVLELLS